MKKSADYSIRLARGDDLERLYALELATFETDQLSQRRMKHWISAENGILLIAEQGEMLLGYCLALLHRGTRLARLYSLAVVPAARGSGVAGKLLKKVEARAAKRGRLFMRLEVAQDNYPAIKLYERMGYVIFETVDDYYEDHRSALRMQKRIRYVPANLKHTVVPWYCQTTEFSCGPAAVMMAMAALDKKMKLSQELELDIWREATTIFMTSGHGGCHPAGLALAAHRRGFKSRLIISTREPLFVDGVRNLEKKSVLEVVHKHFIKQAKKAEIPIRYVDVSQQDIQGWLNKGWMVLMLISTYRLDRRKSPHWVTITAFDDVCFYVHDPDLIEGERRPLDCQDLPIARSDFDKMSVFGRNRLRTAVVIRK